MKHLGIALFVLAAGAGPVLASPFDGTWKLDLGRSKFTGDTVTYTKTATGFTYSNGATVSYHFAIDGKAYPTIPSRTTTWTKTADGGWDAVTRANGKVVAKAHRMLSADGKTMTGSYTDYLADGTTEHESDAYTRVSGTSGLAGKWRDTKVQTTSDTMKIATPTPGHFSIDSPRDKETIVGATDGTPAAIKAPNAPPGAMLSIKAEGPRTWTRAVTLHGKVYVRGTMVVSPGDKTLTMTTWVPGKQSEAAVSVYARQ